MRRSQVNRVRLPDGRVRLRARIEGDDCPLDQDRAAHRSWLLTTLAASPDLLALDLSPFDTLRMVHDGTRWVVDLEAVSFPAAGVAA